MQPSLRTYMAIPIPFDHRYPVRLCWRCAYTIVIVLIRRVVLTFAGFSSCIWSTSRTRSTPVKRRTCGTCTSNGVGTSSRWETVSASSTKKSWAAEEASERDRLASSVGLTATPRSHPPPPCPVRCLCRFVLLLLFYSSACLSRGRVPFIESFVRVAAASFLVDTTRNLFYYYYHYYNNYYHYKNSYCYYITCNITIFTRDAL